MFFLNFKGSFFYNLLNSVFISPRVSKMVGNARTKTRAFQGSNRVPRTSKRSLYFQNQPVLFWILQSACIHPGLIALAKTLLQPKPCQHSLFSGTNLRYELFFEELYIEARCETLKMPSLMTTFLLLFLFFDREQRSNVLRFDAYQNSNYPICTSFEFDLGIHLYFILFLA